MMHVLIADDSLTVRSNLRDAFKDAGFDPTICESFSTARRSLREKPYALFVFDLKFSDGHGLALVGDVRASSEIAARPVIVISGDSDLPHRIRGIRAGANEFIGKPYAEEYVVRRAVELTSLRPRPAKARTSAVPSRVLVVDDSATYGNALAEELRRDRHDVVLAASGVEALEFLALQPAECIILDVFMPEMSGVDVYRRLRSEPAWADIPVLMLTGRKDSVVKEEASQAGVDDFAVKSHDLGRLRLRVQELLERPPPSSRLRHRSDPKSPRGAAPAVLAEGELAARVVAVSGLSELLARSSIERACQRAGVDPKTMTAADLRRALPHIQRILSLFLSVADAEERMAAIEALARGDRCT
jgi:DNA-binding response OmpR family regulator